MRRLLLSSIIVLFALNTFSQRSKYINIDSLKVFNQKTQKDLILGQNVSIISAWAYNSSSANNILITDESNRSKFQYAYRSYTCQYGSFEILASKGGKISEFNIPVTDKNSYDPDIMLEKVSNYYIKHEDLSIHIGMTRKQVLYLLNNQLYMYETGERTLPLQSSDPGKTELLVELICIQYNSSINDFIQVDSGLCLIFDFGTEILTDISFYIHP